MHESGKIKPSHRITVEEVIREIRRRVENINIFGKLALLTSDRLRKFAEDRTGTSFTALKPSMALAAEVG